MTERKEAQTLSMLLDEDRELVLSRLQADRTPGAALRVLEQETDRLMLRAGELPAETIGAGGAQQLLQVVKNALPLVGAVTETELWQKQTGRERMRFRLSLPSVLLLAGGAVCVLAGLIGQSAAGLVLRPMSLLWSAAGCLLLAGGGYLAGRGGRTGAGSTRGSGQNGQTAETAQNFLVDPDGVWHVYKGMMLTADHSLEQVQARARALEEKQTGAAERPLPKTETEFYAELLENAYARLRHTPSDAPAREQVEVIRYYLHAKGIETLDYTPQDAARFECLPGSGQAQTLRPALVSGTTLLRKGLAAV